MNKLCLLICLALNGCGFVGAWQIEHPDNSMEEIVEEEIKKITGKDVDLTPFTGPEHQVELFRLTF